MQPINFEGAKWIGKPPSMSDEEYFGMPGKPGHAPSIEQQAQWFQNALEAVKPLVDGETVVEYGELMKAFFKAVILQIRPVHFFGIPTMFFIDQHSYPQWLTAWKPNLDDLNALNAGSAVWIQSLSEGLVPMAVFTVNEKGESNNE
jgi:hypothetical protein